MTSAIRESQPDVRAIFQCQPRSANELLRLISHELRTPVTAMHLSLRMLDADETLTQRQRDALLRITHSYKRLLGLVDAILAYARITDGRHKPVYEPFSVSALIRQAVEDTRAQLEKKNGRFMVELQDEMPELCNEKQLVELIVRGLIVDAVKATSKGEVAVSGKCEDNVAVLTVRDGGPELPSDLDRQTFEQAIDSVGSSRMLSLLIVRELVGAVGGSIVFPRVERGNEVRVTIPSAELAKTNSPT